MMDKRYILPDHFYEGVNGEIRKVTSVVTNNVHAGLCGLRFITVVTYDRTRQPRGRRWRNTKTKQIGIDTFAFWAKEDVTEAIKDGV